MKEDPSETQKFFAKAEGETRVAALQANGFVVDIFVAENGNLGITVERSTGSNSVDIFVRPDLKVTYG